MKVNLQTHTDGKSEFTAEERMILINRLDLGFNSKKLFPDDPFTGELRAYFDPSGFTEGSWNNEGHGLIYKNKLWLREFKYALRAIGLSIKGAQNIAYNDKELQGDNYVSLQCGDTFYKSWVKLVKAGDKLDLVVQPVPEPKPADATA
jgi:hypothetical protein